MVLARQRSYAHTAQLEEHKQLKILLIDRPENLRALERALGCLGQNLVTATSRDEVLKHVMHEDFAAILVDVETPEIDGFETAGLIRSRRRSRHTPILFLSDSNLGEGGLPTMAAPDETEFVFKSYELEAIRANVAAFVELARKTKELEAEVHRRKRAEREVRQLNQELEARVLSRTGELEAANCDLQAEVRERTRMEEALISNQADIELLNRQLKRAMRETHHRVKNNLQIIAAMVDLRLMDSGEAVAPDDLRRLGSQVQTLALVHDLLTHDLRAEGEAESLPAEELLRRIATMMRGTAGERTVTVHSDPALLSARQGTSLALVVNELIRNALIHGQGDVVVSFTVVEREGALVVEDAGPGFASDFDPARESQTGLDLVTSLTRWDVGGEATFSNRPEGGARVAVTVPLRITTG